MRIVNAEKTIQDYVSVHHMASFLNEDLLDALQLFHFPAYSHIYIEQDKQHYLYFLIEGQVQCNHYHLNGKLAVFALSQPFCLIGDLEILSDKPLNSNVTATENTIMLGIQSDIVQRYGANDPVFLRFLLEQIREKMFKSTSLQTANVLPTINRLAIYMLANSTWNENKGCMIILPSKEELASLMGTTPRHLNRVIKQLVESGAISGGYPLVQILNRTALENLTS